MIGDYVQLTMGRNGELMDRNGVRTEAENNGQKWGMDRNRETKDRSRVWRETEK